MHIFAYTVYANHQWIYKGDQLDDTQHLSACLLLGFGTVCLSVR